jgi:Fis family transcriptional regulator
MKKTDSLADCVTHSMQQYLKDLNGEAPSRLHSFFMQEVEKPFLKVIMEHVDGNQSQAAAMLGINRNTLRKKLQTYDLLS